MSIKSFYQRRASKTWWKDHIGDKIIDFILLTFFDVHKTLKNIYFNTYFQIGVFPKVYVQEHPLG